MDRGAWRATDHGIEKSQTRLSDFHFHFQSLSDCPHRDILGWPRDICFSFSTYWFHFSVGIITAHMYSQKLIVPCCSLFMTTRQVREGNGTPLQYSCLESSCPQSFPASGSFEMSHLFTSGGQSIGASASASVLPMNIQD